jgi:hypothetical protein
MPVRIVFCLEVIDIDQQLIFLFQDLNPQVLGNLMGENW